MYVTAIVLAAGKGVRFGARCSKPLVEIDSKPLVAHSLLCLDKHRLVDEIIVVANAANREKIIKAIEKYRFHKVKKVVLGGKRRQDSVRHGLAVLPRQVDVVLIHDCARPFIDGKIVTSAVKEAQRSHAAIVGVPVKATIKSVKVSKCQGVKARCIVEKTLDRKKLWEIQTPQVFRKEVIVEAYKKFGRMDVTDDAALVEKLGYKVSLVMGAYSNIKITTPEDLPVARALLKTKR
jgi:2-C-methyl-D-erythritol 4-phosphate cytidylyltransferase